MAVNSIMTDDKRKGDVAVSLVGKYKWYEVVWEVNIISKTALQERPELSS